MFSLKKRKLILPILIGFIIWLIIFSVLTGNKEKYRVLSDLTVAGFGQSKFRIGEKYKIYINGCFGDAKVFYDVYYTGHVFYKLPSQKITNITPCDSLDELPIQSLAAIVPKELPLGQYKISVDLYIKTKKADFFENLKLNKNITITP